MLYLDYSRPGPMNGCQTVFGGRENLEAISFLRRCNAEVFQQFPETTTAAEESTAWPAGITTDRMGVGLGFGYKWNMGWMNDNAQLHRA